MRTVQVILSLLLFCLVLPAQVAHGAVPPSLQLPPEILLQVQRMPPQQQASVAAQYGVSVDELLRQATAAGGSAPRSTIGQPMDPIEPAVPVQRPRPLPLPESRRPSTIAGDEGISAIRAGDRYGLNVFSAEVSTFAPVDNAPVPADYRLGPGDGLTVLLTGDRNEELNLIIDRSGSAQIPSLGRIGLAGMRFEEAAAAIRERIDATMIGTRAQINVAGLRAINVFLAGEVMVPGNRAMSALSRVTHALFAGGGLTDIGSLRDIRVSRGGKVIGTFDSYDLLLRGDSSSDMRLQDGDVVFVPPVRNMAEIGGEVRRPSVYEIHQDTTVDQLINMAGGLTARALRNPVILERQNDIELPTVTSLSLTESTDRSASIVSGDRVRVLSKANRFENRIRLRGAVQRPGVYAWRPGMRVSDLVSNVEGDLLENVDHTYSLVVSTEQRTGRVSVAQFAIQDVIAAPGSEQDPSLWPLDEVLFFTLATVEDDEGEDEDETGREEEQAFGTVGASRTQQGRRLPRNQDPNFDQPAGLANRDPYSSQGPYAPGQFVEPEPEAPDRQTLLRPVIDRLTRQASPTDPVRVVTISGAVHAPGDYPLSASDTISKLIEAAGGMRDDAYTADVELRRVAIGSTGTVEIESQALHLSPESPDYEILLQSRDHLTVRAVPDWRPSDTVTIAGEVRFPGTYVIAPQETLGDLLARAGGPTVDGFPEGTVFTRVALREREQQETRRFVNELRRSAAAATQTQEQQVADFAGLNQLVVALEDSEGQGRLVVDLPRILQGDSSADVILLNGDRIEIPANVTTVTVIGEVLRPGSYRYEGHFSINDYLALSAGASRRADEDRMYVLRANGQVIPAKQASWRRFDLGGSDIRAGDTIVVPIDSSHRNTLDFWRTMVQIVSQTSLALGVVLAI